MHQLADRLLRDRAGNRAAPARLAAALTILLGLAALIGWARGIPALASVLPGSVEMKANTACGLILCGIALFILSKRPSGGMRGLASILCCVVFLTGIATIAEYVLGRTFGIDELMFVDKGGAYAVFRGRMSPFTAVALMGIATALTALPYPRFRDLARLGAAFAILLGATVLLCYLWDADELISDRWLPPVALNTAAGVALLGCGILLAPNEQGNGLNQQIGALAGMEVRILTAFTVALGLLMIGGTYTYRTTVQFADSVEWVAHSQEVRAAVASLYGSLAGSEVALRDYLLTKDSANLNEQSTPVQATC